MAKSNTTKGIAPASRPTAKIYQFPNYRIRRRHAPPAQSQDDVWREGYRAALDIVAAMRKEGLL